ncbi:MAG: aminopeptidase P family protein [Anaerolineae bacterium]|nr:aminopeptidase P family protein [Anaerolineae bacterium]
MKASRIERLISALQDTEFSLLALNPGASLTYLTGLNFHRMERPIVLWIGVDGKIAVTLPTLEIAKLSLAPMDIKAFPYSDDPQTWQKAFQEAARYLNFRQAVIGVEPNNLRVLEYRFLESAFPEARFHNADHILSPIRMIKEEGEVAAMCKAVQIAQSALQATLPIIKPGVTEKEVASELTIQLLRAGSHPQLPFYPIVASGPNSANPHAVPSDRALKAGDFLVIDWGALYDGYCSDLTRTFSIGDIDPELEKVYSLVEKANENGILAVQPGKTAGSVDQAARRVIQAGGFGEFFTHRTGHGLGMEAHEPPYLYQENDQPLLPGMTFTIEPGIYLPEKGGVRIEDNVLVTDSGRECLTNLPRCLQKLG